MARNLDVWLCTEDYFEEEELKVKTDFTNDELKEIHSHVDIPEYWHRTDLGMYVYAANLFDPHKDMCEYFCSISDYLNENNIDKTVYAAFSWDYGRYEVYTITRNEVIFLRDQGYEEGKLLVAEEDRTGLPDDYELIPYAKEYNERIAYRA